MDVGCHEPQIPWMLVWNVLLEHLKMNVVRILLVPELVMIKILSNKVAMLMSLIDITTQMLLITCLTCNI
jgi:hypothetical protein